jgi:hypothetical protein
MTSNSLHQEPQKGIEPLTAGDANRRSGGVPSAEEGSTRAVLRATTPERMQKCDIEERTESERDSSIGKRPRGTSFGTAPLYHLSEHELATRWGRSTNTLVGWRTRLAAGRTRIPAVLIDGLWCYRVDVIQAVEADPHFAWIRPRALRGTPLPDFPTRSDLQTARFVHATAVAPVAETTPLEQLEQLRQTVADLTPEKLTFSFPIAFPKDSVQPELPLSLPAGRVEVMPAPRGFASIRIEAGYALAIATDNTAFFATVLGGLEFVTWHPVASLPSDDEIHARFARRAA